MNDESVVADATVPVIAAFPALKDRATFSATLRVEKTTTIL
jgi:hypothetical protein